MSLTVGTRLGPYEILGTAGAGGMGEVYRAKDTRLDRTVAIKVLSTQLEDRPQLRKRLEREARTISKLSHPHICTLHDVGQQEGVDFLVMEYLEGEVLSHRLQRGPLPAEQTLAYGIEIAAALETAHRQGIVHRDLKPGNVMLTRSGAKLMDFGLAKLMEEPVAAAAGLTEMSTQAPPEKSLTEEGAIVGTIQYMAPEQLEGREAEARTDIFALGAVLYEMATGRPAFTGKTKASVMAAILSSEPPPISRSQPLTPPALDRVVKTCMAKDPEERFASAHDVKLALQWVQEGNEMPRAESAPRGARRWAWPAISLVLLAALALATVLWWRARNAPQEAMFFQAPLPFTAQDMAFSPNGRTLAAVGYLESANRNVIWLYDVGARRAESVPGTEGATYPFWSPDGRYVGFFADGKLKKAGVPGGPVQTICDAPAGRGGTWNQDGVILFAPTSLSGLFRVPASGGALVQVSKVDAAHQQMSHRWPVFLPDGNHFLYLAANFAGHLEANAVFLGALDSEPPRMIVQASSNVVPVAPGYLLFYRDRALMAQPFELRRMALSGEPLTVAADVQFMPEVDRAVFAVSNSGALMVQGASRAPLSQLLLLDRNGKQLATVGQPAMYGNVALAPDGRRIAFDITDLDTMNINLWTMDLSQQTAKRLTFDPSLNGTPVWSPDGRQLLFGSNRGLAFELYLKNSDGSGQEKLLFHVQGTTTNPPTDWSRDGKYMLFERETELWYLALPEGQDKPLVQIKAVVANGQFSPDGRWVAYASNETGKWEVYVTSFPEPRGKWQVSAGGGREPRWRGDGRELFYLSPEGKMMAVQVNAGATFDAGTPVALFQARPHKQVAALDIFTYDVSRDGQRFLINTQVERPERSPMSVILNWTAGLEK